MLSNKKADEDRERRSVDEFDRRQGRNRRQRDSEVDRNSRESGKRRGDFDRDGERDWGERREMVFKRGIQEERGRY